MKFGFFQFKVPHKYKIEIKVVNPKQISFDKFYGKSVLTWCTRHCNYSKICGHCPNPINNFNKDSKKIIQRFKHGLIIIIKVPSEELAGKNIIKRRLPAKSQHILNLILLKLKEKLEKEGYKRFLLLSGGPCKLIYCWNKSCNLIIKGKCTHQSLAHPAMEACGINVFKTVKDLGYEIYWIDKNTKPEDISYGLRIGLILFDK